MIDLFVFAVYLAMQWVFAFLQHLYWLLSGVIEPPEDAPVRLMSILYRRKRDPAEISRWEDFIAVHKSFVPFDILESDHWSLYAFDRKFAYFVELPESIISYNVRKYPFVFMPYFSDAKQLAVVPLGEFLLWADKLAVRPQPKTVVFTNTARCGSTLLAQMLDHPGASICFGEFHPLTILAIGYWEQYWREDEMELLLRAVVTVLRKDVPIDHICVLKTESTEVRLVPFLANVFPEIKHVFMFRKNCLDSVERMLVRDSMQYKLFRLYFVNRTLCKAFGWVFLGESKWLRVIRPRNIKEWAAIVYASPYADYLKNEQLFCVPVIWHEAVISDTENTLRPLFRELDLPENKIKDALLCLKNDSQKETFLSQRVMKDVKTTEMTEAIRARLDYIADVLGVPKDIFAQN